MTKIQPADFGLFDWPAIREHIKATRMEVQVEIHLFASGDDNGWAAEAIRTGSMRTAQTYRFWLDPMSRRIRPRLTDPDRAAYITRQERKFLEDFLRTITGRPWLNLRVVWLKNEEAGVITVQFKVYDYEPFLKAGAAAPHQE